MTGILDYLYLILFGGLIAVCIPVIVHVWRDKAPNLKRMPTWWWFGPLMWRGLLRSLPLVVLGAIAGLVPAIIGEVTETTGEPTGLLLLLALVTAGISLGCMLLPTTVILWNVPKVMVPPHLREQPGLLEEKRGQARKGTGRDNP